MGVKIVTTVLLGPLIFVVVIFEVILNATEKFNYGNIKLRKN